LKALPAFRSLSLMKLRQMIDQFINVEKIRNAYLFQEGDEAKYVYVIREGDFYISKKINRVKEPYSDQLQKIFKDALKVKR
jgi:CRP-like cAMP-binding protein